MYALSAAVRIDNIDASIGANGYIQPEIKTTNARYFMGPHAVNTMSEIVNRLCFGEKQNAGRPETEQNGTSFWTIPYPIWDYFHAPDRLS